jgi:dTDP-4-amino-4,6-dideoxygalactose transaminase
MSDVLAAFLYGQLEQWQTIQAKRRALWEKYDEALSGWAEDRGFRRPVIPAHCEQAYHMYYLLAPSLEHRSSLISGLKENSISAVFHYLPLNQSDYARRLSIEHGTLLQQCPVTEEMSDRLLRLPFYTSMSREDQDRVIEALLNC